MSETIPLCFTRFSPEEMKKRAGELQSLVENEALGKGFFLRGNSRRSVGNLHRNRGAGSLWGEPARVALRDRKECGGEASDPRSGGSRGA